MAYAAYCDSFGANVTRLPDSRVTPQTAPVWAVLDITVPSCDALGVRRALVTCEGVGILRCIPRLDEHRVRLEIRLPRHMLDQVITRVLGCVPGGEIGHVTSWHSHLQRHGLTHGV